MPHPFFRRRRASRVVVATSAAAAQFVGTNGTVLKRGSADAALTFGDETMSCGCWLQLNSRAVVVTVAMGQWDGTALSGRSYMIGYSSFTDRLSFRVVSDFSDQYSVDSSSLGQPALDTWYFVVGWHNAATNQIGIRVGGAGATNTAGANFGIRGTAASPFGIGNATAAGGQTAGWDGIVDEAFVYDGVALSDAAVDALWNNGDGTAYEDLTAGQLTNLVGWWKLNEETDANTWEDAHTGGYDLTRFGTVTSVEGKL